MKRIVFSEDAKADLRAIPQHIALNILRIHAVKDRKDAYWGYKWEAKKESNRIRRENAKRDIRQELTVSSGGRKATDC